MGYERFPWLTEKNIDIDLKAKTSQQQQLHLLDKTQTYKLKQWMATSSSISRKPKQEPIIEVPKMKSYKTA